MQKKYLFHVRLVDQKKMTDFMLWRNHMLWLELLGINISDRNYSVDNGIHYFRN